MFALRFRFPAGRYHATPWGKHVNEGDVAWPPEPYRILRTLIATWHRKADRTRFPETILDALIHALAEELPHFSLPDAVHAHTRHYMPGKSKPVLVLDAFLRIRPNDALVAAWPESRLGTEQIALAEHLCERISYFGRAESISIVEPLGEYDPSTMNCFPFPHEALNESGRAMCDVLAPLSADAYAAAREHLLRLSSEKSKKKRERFEITLPKTLREALEVETSDLQEVGWSRPPAGRSVLYSRPQIGPRPPAQAIRDTPGKTTKRPTVARLVLAGKPKPRIEEALKIGELFRCALIWKTGHTCVSDSSVPIELLGRDAATNQPAKTSHSHAFFLPEDADGDGRIDHLLLYAANGLSSETQKALGNLQRLWLNERPRTDTDEEADEGRREWRVALEGFGKPNDFADESPLLGTSASWVSTTPYLRPWHLKGKDIAHETLSMIEKECRLREPLGAHFERAELIGDGTMIKQRNVLAFHRFRARRGLTQPDRTGSAIRLVFSEPVAGPVALGFACHYGLGLFRAEHI